MKQTLLKSFVNAASGIRHFFLHERNGKIQATVAVLTLIASFVLKTTNTECVMILFCIALVIGLEMINSALEKLCDMVQKEYHPTIKIVKDVAAGAVLFASVLSVITGCIIFLPKIFVLL
jgi:diacylglycerol kinase